MFSNICKLNFCEWLLLYYNSGWKLLHWLEVLSLAIWDEKQLLKCNVLSVPPSIYLTRIPVSHMCLTNERSSWLMRIKNRKKIKLCDTNTVVLLTTVIIIDILKMQFCYFLTHYFLIYRLYIDTTLKVSEWKDLRCLQVLLWHFLVRTQKYLAWYLFITSYSKQETVTGVWLKNF